MRRLAALPVIALSFAIACDNSTAPDPQQTDGLAFQEGPSDQECVGTLLPGRYQNVFVPPGGDCTLMGSTLTGNLVAFQESRLQAVENLIHGNVRASEKSIVVLTNNEIQGSVEGIKATTVHVGGGSVRQNILVKEAEAGLAVSLSLVEVLEGNVQIEKNVGTGLFAERVTVAKGNMKVEDNTLSVLLSLRNNAVAQNMQVFKNKGPGAKQVELNQVGQDLQCFENDPPFDGSPNTAKKAEGQCSGTPF